MSPKVRRDAEYCGICDEEKLLPGLYAVKETDPLVRVPACKACWALQFDVGMPDRKPGEEGNA